MSVRITGSFNGRPTAVTVQDGQIIDGEHELVAMAAQGAVRAEAEVNVPGVWAGPASLDGWGLRALFTHLLDNVQFEGDPPPALGGSRGADVIN